MIDKGVQEMKQTVEASNEKTLASVSQRPMKESEQRRQGQLP